MVMTQHDNWKVNLRSVIGQNSAVEQLADQSNSHKTANIGTGEHRFGEHRYRGT